MAFPEAEYRRRVEKGRGDMTAWGLDALLVTDVPNICYLSGYETFAPSNFGCLILPGDAGPTLQVPEFEIPGALLSGRSRTSGPADSTIPTPRSGNSPAS